jgi:hypothetical protein
VSNFDDFVVARTAITTDLADADLFPVVDDPAGTPSTKKITALNTRAYTAVDTYQNHGNTSTTETVDLANGTVHRVVLDDNCTLTFSGATSGSGYSFTLIVVQDGTGGRTVTWPGSVDWAASTAPTLSTAVNAVDVLTFFTVDGGTTWFGFVAGLGMG